MTAEETLRTMDLLHHVEGIEMLLDSVERVVKQVEPRRRGDALVSLGSARRMQRRSMEILIGLLDCSERIEAKRKKDFAALIRCARDMGREDILDWFAGIVEEQRRQLANDTSRPLFSDHARRRKGKGVTRPPFRR